MDIHRSVSGPVAHGEDVDGQIDVTRFTLILHVLRMARHGNYELTNHNHMLLFILTTTSPPKKKVMKSLIM